MYGLLRSCRLALQDFYKIMLNAGGKKNSKFLVGEDLLCNNAAMMVPVLRDIRKKILPT